MILNTKSLFQPRPCLSEYTNGICPLSMLNRCCGVSFLDFCFQMIWKYFHIIIYLLRTCFYLGDLLFANWLSFWTCFSGTSILSLSWWSHICQANSTISFRLESIRISLLVPYGLYTPLSHFICDQPFRWTVSCFRHFVRWRRL